MRRLKELSSFCSGLHFFLGSIQKALSVLDKNTNVWHFKTTVGYIFSKYVHCVMQFLVGKNSVLLC